jgi:hypothetical protein
MKIRLAAVALLCLPITSETATAQTPEYVGTWAARAAQCRLGQESQDAPMIIKRDRYDQHEAHCIFKSVRKQGQVWTILSECEVEGDKQNHNFTLQVSGNRLTIRDEIATRVLQRCR